ncbi:hypothetical protein K443DRAFT_6843 [Laccaria amethystina LaAM-08-1]|uniref:Uncharacterized protein n=1 Tax=Laccaria amethystina LaAM-08-1 TaxID=1095629 RepID=A0A0C9X9B0_9AGAR|nr:hypothetical protein K443DRAFT_6843 [Laccaria amethystina LaAM-08-1]
MIGVAGCSSMKCPISLHPQPPPPPRAQAWDQEGSIGAGFISARLLFLVLLVLLFDISGLNTNAQATTGMTNTDPAINPNTTETATLSTSCSGEQPTAKQH